MKFVTKELVLPAYLASALINGDVSGLDDRDVPWVQTAHDRAAQLGGRIVSCEDDIRFMSGFLLDLPGHLGCDVLTYTVLCEVES